MDDKNIALLMEVKKQLSKQNNNSVIREETTAKFRFKPKAKVLADDAPAARALPTQVDVKSEQKAKKKKRKRTKTGINNEIITKSSQVKATTQRPLDLICTLPLADKSKNRPLKPAISIQANHDFKPRFVAKHHFNLPEWFNAGKSLQHPLQQEGAARPIIVRIGIDFGTAFTKVAVKIGFDTVIIDWSPLTGRTQPNERNLVPGIVAKAPSGEYCWQDFSANTLLTNLKLPLLSETNHGKCPVASIAYLAFVIRYTRAAIYQLPELGRKLAQSNIRWELNIGCATEPYDKDPIVEQIRKVGQVAWSQASASNMSAVAIESAWHQSIELNGLEAPPEVTPEFIAQIAGYLMSPQLKDGLHLLIDVGAATLDVASFNVVQDRENYSVAIPIFCSRVINLGTHFLQYHRHTGLGLKPSWDDTVPVKNTAQFAQSENLKVSSVDAADKSFSQEVTKTISQIVINTKRSRKGVPNSPTWSDGLPVFITGGGAESDIYRRAIDQTEQQFKRDYPMLNRFRFIPYNSGTFSSNGSNQQIDGRLSVAIGLTEDAASIARIIPTREISDVERGVKDKPGHAEIYAK